jgi:hypothetical protein
MMEQEDQAAEEEEESKPLTLSSSDRKIEITHQCSIQRHRT